VENKQSKDRFARKKEKKIGARRENTEGQKKNPGKKLIK